MSRVIAAVLTSALSAAAWAAPVHAQDVGLPIGASAPGVVLEDLDGNDVDLAEFIGSQPMLLEFWASWCAECAKLAPKIDAAHDRYGQAVQFVVVAVAVNQTPRRVKRHFAENQHDLRVLWDGGGKAVRAYKVPTTAVVMLVDREGKIAYTGVGGDQDFMAALSALAGT